MSDAHSHDEIKKHIRVYLTVFVALLVGSLPDFDPTKFRDWLGYI